MGMLSTMTKGYVKRQMTIVRSLGPCVRARDRKIESKGVIS